MSIEPRPGSGELRRVLVHEYAHLAAARHFGAAGFVRVLRVRDDAAGVCFAGRFQLYGALDDDAWRIVALAGVVAECIDAGCDDDAERLHRHVGEALAGVDGELARDYLPRHVDCCRAILRATWRALVDDAEEHARRCIAGWP